MVTQEELERHRHLPRLRRERDDAFDAEIREKALSTSYVKGIAKGILIGRIQIFEIVLRREITPIEVLRTQKLEELGALAGDLASELPTSELNSIQQVADTYVIAPAVREAHTTAPTATDSPPIR